MPAVVRVFGFPEQFSGDGRGGKVRLLSGAIRVQGEVLGTEAHADPQASFAERSEVGIVELLAAIRGTGNLDGALHLRGDLGDLVGGANIAGRLRVLLAFNVPGDHALST